MKCPECKLDLISLKLPIEDVLSPRWVHPPSNCLTSSDGVKMKIEITDEIAFKRFQLFIEKNQARRGFWQRIRGAMRKRGINNTQEEEYK